MHSSIKVPAQTMKQVCKNTHILTVEKEENYKQCWVKEKLHESILPK